MPNVSLSSLKPSTSQRNNIDDAKHHNDASAQRSSAMKRPGIANVNASSSSKQARHAHPILNEAVANLTGDVVVLGGYRGSILRSAKPPHKQLWVPVKVRNALAAIRFVLWTDVGLLGRHESSSC